MARGGRATFTVDSNQFNRLLEVALRKVENGTKRATLEAVKEIYRESQRQVPRDTNTLAQSGFYEVRGYKGNFQGTVGYGGNGNPVNPKTGHKATDYMVIVHEDLGAYHPVGNAKFLEIPVRMYQSKMGARASHFIRQELS